MNQPTLFESTVRTVAPVLPQLMVAMSVIMAYALATMPRKAVQP